MLIADADLFGPRPHQVDIFEAIAEAEQLPTINPTKEVPMAANINAGDRVRYHGSKRRAHGVGFVVEVRADGRLWVHVDDPDCPNPWRESGVYNLYGVRSASVTVLDEPLSGPDYGDELGVIDLFGAGQLALEVA